MGLELGGGIWEGGRGESVALGALGYGVHALAGPSAWRAPAGSGAMAWLSEEAPEGPERRGQRLRDVGVRMRPPVCSGGSLLVTAPAPLGSPALASAGQSGATEQGSPFGVGGAGCHCDKCTEKGHGFAMCGSEALTRGALWGELKGGHVAPGESGPSAGHCSVSMATRSKEAEGHPQDTVTVPGHVSGPEPVFQLEPTV